MKKLFMMMISILPLWVQAQNISIFCDHIGSIAQQENISFAEAAAKIKAMGYTGIDVPVDLPAEKVKALEDLGFGHACAIAQINYYKGEQHELEEQSLAFMKANGYERLLVVPGLKPENAPKGIDEKVYARLKSFTERATKLGFKVTVEDYDNPASPCYNTVALDKVFLASPKTGHTFDTGNYLFCGEDALEALKHFMDKVWHVHLKDRVAKGDYRSPAIGTGIIPIQKIISALQTSGYEGWYTVEHYGSQNMLRDAELSIRFVQTALAKKDFPEQEGMKPEMSEYWTPQPKLVAPGDATHAPSDAIVLFDGKHLREWVDEQGNMADWKIENGVLVVDKAKGDILTKQKFGSFQLHLEWRIPTDIQGSNQARGNSGVYLQDKYEVQILDSYRNPTYVNGQAASIYKQTPPLVNAMRAPGEWNTYDILYSAPIFKEDGAYLVRPYVTVIHNGVVVQNHTEILGTTEYIGFPKVMAHGDGPIRLQSHGDPSAPISFRNIWIRKM